MRFVHISDLHLGKLLFQQNLLSVQIDLLNQVTNYLVDNNIDVLIIAGDIYDRSVPSNEAVEALNDFLSNLILKYHKKVLMISGNHDSASRLNFASSLLKNEGLYIESFVMEKMKPIEIDGVNFYLLPFFKPSYLRYLYQDNSIITYQDAFKAYIDRQDIDLNQTNVLITHQFIAGNKEVVKSESEAILSVGGSEIIDVSLVKMFDYVALGHIHAPQKISKDSIRYSGSLMRYSFDEVKQQKSIVDVTIENKQVTYQLVSLKPKQDLIKLVGYFEEIMEMDSNHNDFIAVELLDDKLVPNAIDYLRTKFANVLQITYPNLVTKQLSSNTKADEGFEKMTTIQLFEQFYQKIQGKEITSQEKKIISDLLKEDNHYDA